MSGRFSRNILYKIYKHLANIRKSLQIPEGATATTWRHFSKRRGEEGAQIDLLFDRPDGVVTICEIKYRKEPYVIDKAYAKELVKKEEIYRKVVKTDKQIFVSIITSCRLKKNMYSEELIKSEVKLDDLFSANHILFLQVAPNRSNLHTGPYPSFRRGTPTP